MKLKFFVLSCSLAVLFVSTSVTATSSTFSEMGDADFVSVDMVAENATSDVQAARIFRVAKKVWDKSGKEVAKFVAYEIVTAGIDWAIGGTEEIEVIGDNSVANEKEVKMAKL